MSLFANFKNLYQIFMLRSTEWDVMFKQTAMNVVLTCIEVLRSNSHKSTTKPSKKFQPGTTLNPDKMQHAIPINTNLEHHSYTYFIRMFNVVDT